MVYQFNVKFSEDYLELAYSFTGHFHAQRNSGKKFTKNGCSNVGIPSYSQQDSVSLDYTVVE